MVSPYFARLSTCTSKIRNQRSLKNKLSSRRKVKRPSKRNKKSKPCKLLRNKRSTISSFKKLPKERKKRSQIKSKNKILPRKVEHLSSMISLRSKLTYMKEENIKKERKHLLWTT